MERNTQVSLDIVRGWISQCGFIFGTMPRKKGAWLFWGYIIKEKMQK